VGEAIIFLLGWFLGCIQGIATDVSVAMAKKSKEKSERKKYEELKKSMNQTHEELKNQLTAIEKEISDLGTIKNEIRKQLNAVCPHEDTYLVDSWGSMDDEIIYKCRNCYGYITKDKEVSNG